MTDKERLIELLEQEKAFSRSLTDDERRERLADYLLESGVIVPPCKLGDKIYVLTGSSEIIVELIVCGIHYTKQSKYGKLKDNQYLVAESRLWRGVQHINTNDIGKTVFLNCKEAEQALKGGNNNG